MNTVGNLLTAYFNLLNNQVPGFTVHKITVPENVNTNYIWLYPEGGADDINKRSKNETIIIRLDIVTLFQNDIDQTNCENADTIAYDLIVPSAGTVTGLTPPAGLQFLNVTRENYSYLIERQGSGAVYRKISRYSQRVHQTQ